MASSSAIVRYTKPKRPRKKRAKKAKQSRAIARTASPKKKRARKSPRKRKASSSRPAKGSAAAKAWGRKMAAARKRSGGGKKRKKSSKAKAKTKSTGSVTLVCKPKRKPPNGFSSWSAYMASIRPGGGGAKRRAKRKTSKLAKRPHHHLAPITHAGPRGGIVVRAHRGSSRCSACGGNHTLRQHNSHARGPHNWETRTQHSYKGLAPPPKNVGKFLARRNVRNLKDAKQVLELERLMKSVRRR